MDYPVLKIQIMEVEAAGMSCIFLTLKNISMNRKPVPSGQMLLMKSIARLPNAIIPAIMPRSGGGEKLIRMILQRVWIGV